MRLAVVSAMLLLPLLSLLPSAAAPPAYWEEARVPGFIHCSLGLYPFQTTDFCAEPGEMSSANSQHRVPFGEGLSAALVRLTWTQSSPTGGHLLSLVWVDPDGVRPAEIEGASPLEHGWEFRADDAFTQAAGTAVLDVRAAAGETYFDLDGAGLLVLEQPYGLCVAFFYHGAEERVGIEAACRDP